MGTSILSTLTSMSPMALAVLVALAVLSVWSLAISGERLFVLLRARRQSLAFARSADEPMRQGQIRMAIEAARKYPASHLGRIVTAGLTTFEKKSVTRPAPEAIEAAARAVERSILSTTAELGRGIGGLATIATTAPFIGLFGTVVGIIHAFSSIAMSGAGGLAAVSAGIAEALVTTAFGLFVAIPAAWMFNVLTHRIARLGIEMDNVASELRDLFSERGGESHAS
ncbi:MAG TPA: MotA/TolQ/ExbB proton channel family protein [Thermoanaerobaculia bacterium]|nr:MotA/TolQ/ExbB proton channel family protein [Thermoanaerobaculia bacterium]